MTTASEIAPIISKHVLGASGLSEHPPVGAVLAAAEEIAGLVGALDAAHVKALDELVAFVEADCIGPSTEDDPDEDCVGWSDSGPLPMTFGHIRRARRAVDALTDRASRPSEPAEADRLPQPDRNRAGKEPCGECFIREGETCDICGASRAALHNEPASPAGPCDCGTEGGR